MTKTDSQLIQLGKVAKMTTVLLLHAKVNGNILLDVLVMVVTTKLLGNI